jgi:alkanesulfonate monooxygenase SsuD/methylene tetrahydromethanopterin reductase-like flavin-dependent oxidoreductase (luciferase family)
VTPAPAAYRPRPLLRTESPHSRGASSRGAVADHLRWRDRTARLKELSRAEGELDAWLDGLRPQWIVGTLDEAGERIGAYAEAGVERVMLQHQLHDDLDVVLLMARLV